jgi:nitrogen fixation NifU-like protein
MMEEMYSKKALQHFSNPKNMGEMKDADGIGTVGNPVCGDVMKLFIKVKKVKGKEIIKDIKFQTFGCVAAIATSSVMTEIAKGKTLEEAQKLSREDIAKALGGLPAIKLHCSVLVVDALKAAIKDYRGRRK